MAKQTLTIPRAFNEPLPEMAACSQPFAPLFRSRRSRQSVERYVTGVLTDQPRKNCQTIPAAMTGLSAERLQHLQTDATRDHNTLEQAGVEALSVRSPEGGILVLDDTGLPKPGQASVLGGTRTPLLRPWCGESAMKVTASRPCLPQVYSSCAHLQAITDAMDDRGQLLV